MLTSNLSWSGMKNLAKPVAYFYDVLEPVHLRGANRYKFNTSQLAQTTVF